MRDHLQACVHSPESKLWREASIRHAVDRFFIRGRFGFALGVFFVANLPMKTARLTSSAPVLFVRDVVAAANHYRDALGFTYDRFWGEPPDFVILRRDGLNLMLSLVPTGTAIVPHWQVKRGMWNAYFWVDDADALFAEFTRRGARIDYGLGNKPYGVREFGVQDLDGHDLGFGQLL